MSEDHIEEAFAQKLKQENSMLNNKLFDSFYKQMQNYNTPNFKPEMTHEKLRVMAVKLANKKLIPTLATAMRQAS